MKAHFHTSGSTVQIVTEVDTTITIITATIVTIILMLMTLTIMVMILRLAQCFPAHDELGTSRS